MPRTYKKAMMRPDAPEWQKACQKEYDCIIKNGTYEMVAQEDLPADANVLGNTCVNGSVWGE